MDYIAKLIEIRRERGYSQTDIAEVLETTQQHYSTYENRKHEMPIRQFAKLCIFYKVSADEILGINFEN